MPAGPRPLVEIHPKVFFAASVVSAAHRGLDELHRSPAQFATPGYRHPRACSWYSRAGRQRPSPRVAAQAVVQHGIRPAQRPDQPHAFPPPRSTSMRVGLDQGGGLGLPRPAIATTRSHARRRAPVAPRRLGHRMSSSSISDDGVPSSSPANNMHVGPRAQRERKLTQAHRPSRASWTYRARAAHPSARRPTDRQGRPTQDQPQPARSVLVHRTCRDRRPPGPGAGSALPPA